MDKKKNLLSYFTRGEIALWVCSVVVILVSFFVFDGQGYLSLASSLVGITSLIFCAKGNPLGQVLIIIFSIIYGIISYSFAYYGEMITYLGMTAPMAIIALIAWLKNPFKGKKSQVRINKIKLKDLLVMLAITIVVTVVFYFILKAFDTANLLISTISIATSFYAVCLTYKRSVLYAVAYGLNDIVLIIMWTMATIENIEYVSVVVCFVVFLVNDIYGFINWTRMQKAQNQSLKDDKQILHSVTDKLENSKAEMLLDTLHNAK